MYRLIAFLFLLLSASLYATGPQTLFEKARSYEQSGDLVSAEAAYRLFLKGNRESAEGWSNLGVVLAGQQKYDAAVQAYARALQLRPSLFQIHLNMGLACYKSSRYPEAVRNFRAYLSQDPSSRQVRQLLATALLESDHYEEAAGVFETLLPTSEFSIQYGLASAYIRLNRLSEAESTLKALVREGESAEILLLLGQAYLSQNRHEDAIAALRRALQLKPSLSGVHFHLGVAFWKRHEYDMAVEEWRQELKQEPSNFEALFALGATLVEKGEAASGPRLEETGKSTDVVQDENGNVQSGTFSRATAVLPRPPTFLHDAEFLLQKAHRLRPAHAATLFYLGKLAWRRNDRLEATKRLQAAVRLEPNLRDAHYLLARIYGSQNRAAQAQRELRMVQELTEKGIQADIDILNGARSTSTRR